MDANAQEMVDVLDAGGGRTGRVVPKAEAHRFGLPHRCAHVWISTPEGHPRLYVQRRASGKETWPDRLDVTAAGHLMSGEESVEGALRELEEELGLVAEPGDLIPLGTRRVEKEIPVGLDNEFQDVFLLVRAVDIAALRLQTEEVAAVLALSLDDVEALSGGVAVLAEGPDGGRVAISLADFVPGEDGYLPRVARAVRTALAGGRPAPIF